MTKLLNLSLPASWQTFALCTLASAVACGVVEHPHDRQAIDTSDDFGPLGGTGVAAGSAAVISGSPGSSGSVAQGGMPPATAGTGSVAGSVNNTTGGSATGGASSGSAGAVSTGGLSGVTITLGGVNVPKENAIAFIHLGHSNMAGVASSPAASGAFHFTEKHPHAFMYHPGTSPELAYEPKTADPGNNRNVAGPGTALVKEAAMLAPNNYFISLGFGQHSAYCSMFLPGGLLYEDLIAAAKLIKGRVTFGAIFIYLGTTERHGMASDVTGFPNCINTLVTAIRNDVGEPGLPALMNDYEVEAKGEFAVGGDVANAIRPQIAMCPSVVSKFALVSAQGIAMQDDHHFNLDGQRTWAQRALQTLKDKGWRPWAP